MLDKHTKQEKANKATLHSKAGQLLDTGRYRETPLIKPVSISTLNPIAIFVLLTKTDTTPPVAMYTMYYVPLNTCIFEIFDANGNSLVVC